MDELDTLLFPNRWPDDGSHQVVEPTKRKLTGFLPSCRVKLWSLVRSRQGQTKQYNILRANLGSNIMHKVADHLDIVARLYLTKIRMAHKREGS